MNRGHSNEPVTFETQRLGQYRTIASAEEAAQCFLIEWPIHSDHAFMEAQKTCLAVLEGRRTPVDAGCIFERRRGNQCVRSR